MGQAGAFEEIGLGNYNNTSVRVENAIKAAVIGGTASTLTGGKFASGAITGAFSRLLNDDQIARKYEKFDDAVKAQLARTKERYDRFTQKRNDGGYSDYRGRTQGGLVYGSESEGYQLGIDIDINKVQGDANLWGQPVDDVAAITVYAPNDELTSSDPYRLKNRFGWGEISYNNGNIPVFVMDESLNVIKYQFNGQTTVCEPQC